MGKNFSALKRSMSYFLIPVIKIPLKVCSKTAAMTIIAPTMLTMKATYLHFDQVKTQNDQDLISNEIQVSIIKAPRCGIKAVQSIKWVWKPKFIADPAKCEPDYEIPIFFAELQVFYTDKRLQEINQIAEAYFPYLPITHRSDCQIG